MPKHHPVTVTDKRGTWSSCSYEHECHCSRSGKYWIPQIWESVCKVSELLFPVKKNKKNHRASLVPPLSNFTMHFQEPLSTTGIVYISILLMKGIRRQVEKVYRAHCIVPFTSHPLSFIPVSISKFCNRSTFPSLVLGDNATTIAAAAGLLRIKKCKSIHLILGAPRSLFLLKHHGSELSGNNLSFWKNPS